MLIRRGEDRRGSLSTPPRRLNIAVGSPVPNFANDLSNKWIAQKASAICFARDAQLHQCSAWFSVFVTTWHTPASRNLCGFCRSGSSGGTSPVKRAFERGHWTSWPTMAPKIFKFTSLGGWSAILFAFSLNLHSRAEFDIFAHRHVYVSGMKMIPLAVAPKYIMMLLNTGWEHLPRLFAVEGVWGRWGCESQRWALGTAD